MAGSPIPFEEYTALLGLILPSSLSRVTLNDLGTSFTDGILNQMKIDILAKKFQ